MCCEDEDKRFLGYGCGCFVTITTIVIIIVVATAPNDFTCKAGEGAPSGKIFTSGLASQCSGISKITTEAECKLAAEYNSKNNIDKNKGFGEALSIPGCSYPPGCSWYLKAIHLSHVLLLHIYMQIAHWGATVADILLLDEQTCEMEVS